MSLYFDHASTTELTDKVKEAIKNNLDVFCNPSSIYFKALIPQEKINLTKEYIAQAINCSPEEVFFTSGASEANSWLCNFHFIVKIMNIIVF